MYIIHNIDNILIWNINVHLNLYSYLHVNQMAHDSGGKSKLNIIGHIVDNYEVSLKI